MPKTDEIKLFDLAIACFIYSNIEKFDQAYENFLNDVNHNPDLTIETHRTTLLSWLKSWRCRQFANNYLDRASLAIQEWYNTFNSKIVRPKTKILELTKTDLDNLKHAFNSLKDKIASYRGKKKIKIGPTGAAKILFAIRRNAFIPWDNKIRTSLNYDASGDSYANFIQQAISNLKKLKIECENHGFSLYQLPDKLGRINSTVPKLIDEYYWVITNRDRPLPGSELFGRWVKWGGF